MVARPFAMPEAHDGLIAIQHRPGPNGRGRNLWMSAVEKTNGDQLLRIMINC